MSERPPFIGFGCAGLDTNVSAIVWSSYLSTTAAGTGQLNYNTCQPDCAAGNDLTYQVNVTLTDPEELNGYLVFQRVHVAPISGSGPVEDSSQPGAGWGTG